MKIAYPSPQFPALPAVTLDCPDGWSPVPTPQAHLAVGLDVEEGQFRPNVVVILSRLLPGQTLEGTAADAIARLEVLPGYEEVGREDADVAGRPGFRIECSWSDETAGTVAQAVRLAVVEHDGVRDLVQVTGTARGTQVEVAWPWIRAIQDSLTIEA
ncbi:LpqN/LpqT family lipoprotein [Xylanimonas sp. McL0601]|uniref:LpqN/LpqT family lipoprotein n=1 Tax=Xylanimonas sp. McL0601 TaxID=3414739 RepID=UPI003CE7058F